MDGSSRLASLSDNSESIIDVVDSILSLLRVLSFHSSGHHSISHPIVPLKLSCLYTTHTSESFHMKREYTFLL